MKLIRGYYAYMAIAGGLLLGLVLQSNWMLQIVPMRLFLRAHCLYSRCRVGFCVRVSRLTYASSLKWSAGRLYCRRDCCAWCWSMLHLCRCC